MIEEPFKNGEKPQIRDEDGKFMEGNPGGPGRPEGSFSLKTLLEREIQKQPEGQQLSYALALIKKQLRQAIIDGDQQSQKLIWQYIEGMPHQSTDITSAGKPIPILGHNYVPSDEEDKEETSS